MKESEVAQTLTDWLAAEEAVLPKIRQIAETDQLDPDQLEQLASELHDDLEYREQMFERFRRAAVTSWQWEPPEAEE